MLPCSVVFAPSRLIGGPPLVPSGQAETRPTAEAGFIPNQLTTEVPTELLPICDYCNNRVTDGKHVHQSCVSRFDEREAVADEEVGYEG